MANCNSCHDAYGKPTDIGAALGSADFSDATWQAKATDEQIIRQINDGTPEKMEPFKEKLSPDEINALVLLSGVSGRNKFTFSIMFFAEKSWIMGNMKIPFIFVISFFVTIGLYAGFSPAYGQEGEEINPKNYLSTTALPVTVTMAKAPKGDMN